MKINDNGIVRDMTPEEENALLEVQIQLQATEQDKLESQVLYTALITDTLIEEYPISEKVKRFHDLGLYTKEQVSKFYEKSIITLEEYRTIAGESEE